MDEKLEDFEKRVTNNGNVSDFLTRKISDFEDKIASADAASDRNSSSASINNQTRIEELATQLETLRLEVSQLKLNRPSSKMELNSKELNDWFENKFHAFLGAPVARKVINDQIDTKMHTHKV